MNDCPYCEHREDPDYCRDCVSYKLFLTAVDAINEDRRIQSEICTTADDLMDCVMRAMKGELKGGNDD